MSDIMVMFDRESSLETYALRPVRGFPLLPRRATNFVLPISIVTIVMIYIETEGYIAWTTPTKAMVCDALSMGHCT